MIGYFTETGMLWHTSMADFSARCCLPLTSDCPLLCIFFSAAVDKRISARPPSPGQAKTCRAMQWPTKPSQADKAATEVSKYSELASERFELALDVLSDG